MSSSMPPEDIVLEHYCILCHDATRLQGFMLRLKTPLDFDPHPNVPAAIKKCLDASNKKLCLAPQQERHLGSNAHLVHISCLQLAHSRLPRLCIRTLCRIGEILRPVVNWSNSVYLFGPQPMPSFLSGFPLHSTELGALVQQIQQRLPTEIQLMVCKLLLTGLFSSLATCSETVTWLLEQQFANHTAGRSLATKSSLPAVHDVGGLAASVHDVLGESYLAGLQATPLQGGHNHQVQLSSHDILGLKVLLGRRGVVGTRVHYQDGSVSPWLGQSVSKWAYFIRGNDLRRL
ncbi:unnamed protein product [Clonostachys byssicola]|uniref:Uncharacterized protein n=1 Tax=Clonostachys byssicola TaxID=160290 RepID=A0A9N9U8M5_9HYPO|nr:unnamed protein product [Clonostachys byssicola]